VVFRDFKFTSYFSKKVKSFQFGERKEHYSYISKLFPQIPSVRRSDSKLRLDNHTTNFSDFF